MSSGWKYPEYSHGRDGERGRSCFSERAGAWVDPPRRALWGSSVQFSSVAQSCPILCDAMKHSKPCLPVHHRILEFTQTQVHREEGNGIPLQYSCLENPMDRGAWLAAVHRVSKSRTRLNDFTFTFHFHALEKEMAAHSIVLAWRIPGTGEPGGLPSMGSCRVGHH